MDFSTEGILDRMKFELKNEDSHVEGSFTMDNLQAVSEELARFYAMLITPLKVEIANKKAEVATSGNERHYVQWAKEVKDEYGNSVVANARAYGVRDGSGVVYLALISPSANAPNEEAVRLVEEYILMQRPVGAKPIITASQAVSITIHCNIEVKEGFSIDSIKIIAVKRLQEYFSEIAFKNISSGLNYYRVGTIISSIDGINEVLDYTVNVNKESIQTEYDKYFTLEGMILNGCQ